MHFLDGRCSMNAEILDALKKYLRQDDTDADLKQRLMSRLNMSSEDADSYLTKAHAELEAEQKEDLSVAPEETQPVAEFIDPLPEAPAFLKSIPNWIRWRVETGDNGKPTKVPYR